MSHNVTVIEERLGTKSRSILNDKIPSIKETLNNLYECKFCLYNSKIRSNFKRHIRTRHYDGEKIQKQEHVCDYCGKILHSRYYLKLHINTLHEHSYKYICPKCNKGFNRTLQFKAHCKRHLDIVTDPCGFCGTNFTFPGALARHLKICKENPDHIEVNGFVCPTCAAVFSLERHLKAHMKGKHEPPTYKCSECGKLFSWHSCLIKHQKHSHPGQRFDNNKLFIIKRKRPLDVVNDQCQFCGIQFTIPGSLARHLKICKENPDHEETNGCVCPKCALILHSEKQLKEHMQGKHEPPKYKCSECGKLFSWRSSLKFHKKNSHSV